MITPPPTASTRRGFIKRASTVAASLILCQPSVITVPAYIKQFGLKDNTINGVQIGVITYSFRSMKDQSADAMLQYVKSSGVRAIELMGDTAEDFAGKPNNNFDRRAYFSLRRLIRNGDQLTIDQQKQMTEMEAELSAINKRVSEWRSSAELNKFVSLRKMYNDAGIQIYGYKPSTFSKDNSPAEIDFGFRSAKALGASHVTVEHPSDDAHTLMLGQFASKHRIHIAYHGHEQQTPTLWDTALEQSKYNAMNPDIGHYIAAGNPDPRLLINAKHDRISSIHLKDRTNPDHGKANLFWGTGDTPIAEVLQLMKKKKFQFPATIELEYKIPDNSDAIAEVSKCLDYCQMALQ